MNRTVRPKSVLPVFHYDYPKSVIASSPARPRDSAKIMVFDRRSGLVQEDIFSNLPNYLPPGAVLVFNQTKVLPARLVVFRQSTGQVKLLYLNGQPGTFTCLASRTLQVGELLSLQKHKPPLFRVISKQNGEYCLKVLTRTSVVSLLKRFGVTPIPPYIKVKNASEQTLRRDYQTIFARKFGSVAAPTASLHFTNRLLKKIQSRGCKIAFVTLHVGLGTFATVGEKELTSNKLHSEYFHINKRTAKFLNQAKRAGRPIIAVGTTVVRTLESASNQKGQIVNLSGQTTLFIRNGYQFKFVDQLITNFHVPGSSLLMLVATLVGLPKLLSLYRRAIKNGYRLFSFGDGMYLK